MKYILKPPLQHIAVVKIAVTLWNQNDVRALIEIFSPSMHIFTSLHKWQEIEDKVTEKVPQLPLPRLLKKEILGYIKPVGLQILKWIEYHLPCYSLYVVDLPSDFCWSPLGTIDWKKTAKVLIEDKNINIMECYKLARVYCLEDSILELCNQIPENLRESSNDLVSGKNITFPWMHIMNDRAELMADSTSFTYLGVFEHCVERSNKIAAEYFFHKLRSSEKEASLRLAARYVRDEEVMYFLLSQMDEEQQMEVFKSSPYEVLLCFLAWPLQSFFIEIANRLWEFMSDEDYYYIVIKIIDKIQNGYKDWNYQHLFRKVWQKCPTATKIVLIDVSDVLSFLLEIKDQKNLKLVLQDATAVQKKIFIYSGSVLNVFRKLICDNEWDLLECVFRECLSSKYKMVRFKKVFKKHLKLGDTSALNYF